jgi:hypothetical protein
MYTIRIPEIGEKAQLKTALNAYGRDGWELVAVHKQYEWHGGDFTNVKDQQFVYIFKRPKE